MIGRVVVFALALLLASISPPRLEAKPGAFSLRLAGTLPDVEGALLQAVQSINATDWVAWIAADTNGRMTIASLGFVYPPGDRDSMQALQARVWTLLRTVFTVVPSLDEVHLSGMPSTDVGIDPSQPNVTFSAAVSHSEFSTLPQGMPRKDGLATIPRLWYHPEVFPLNRSGKSEVRTATVLAQPGSASRTEVSTRPSLTASTSHLAGQPSTRPLIRVVFRGDPSRRAVAVTFDDGPFPLYTTLLLDTLDHLGLKATFFLVGEQVQQYPYFAQAIVQAGHEIGNHTFHHVRLAHLPESQIEDEIARAQEVITAVTGVTPRYFRPPGGKYTPAILRIASAAGLTTVFWTANSGDYENSGRRVLEAKILGRVTSGGILLLHQGVRETIGVLPETTEVLRRRGLVLTTVSGLLGSPGADAAPSSPLQVLGIR